MISFVLNRLFQSQFRVSMYDIMDLHVISIIVLEMWSVIHNMNLMKQLVSVENTCKNGSRTFFFFLKSS